MPISCVLTSLDPLFADITTTIITLSISFCIYKIIKFYANYLALPPGPIPLPLIGSLLCFKGTKEHWTNKIGRLTEEWGSVFTLYLGPKPFVFVTDIDIARETFRRNDCAGRPDTLFGTLFTDSTGSDVAFADYGQTWETLRRVSHSAAQKYSTSEKLVYLVSDCVDETIDTIIKKEGFGKPVVPFDYFYSIFLNISATSALGKSFDTEGQEYKQMRYVLKDILEDYGIRFLLWEFIPIFRRLDRSNVKGMFKMYNDVKESIRREFVSHLQTYDESTVRDFCDALITAKNEAIAEGKESAPHLTDANLARCVFDLFFGATSTSLHTFRWLALYSLYDTNVRQKLRQEIETQIGDRMPTHEDRGRCHYVMAFIAETLRVRNVAPFGGLHKTLVKSKIGEHTIPKGTGIVVYQSHILRNEKYWPNADQFNPERFLEDGVYITTRPAAFIPFGVGRRVCLGEKLAIAQLFLIFVRFVQKSIEYDIQLHSHNGTEMDPMSIEIRPYDYEIVLRGKTP